MAYERDEDFWYGPGWPDLRSQLVKLCLRHADNFLEILANPAIDCEGIEKSCGLCPPTPAIWTIRSVFVRTRDGPDRLADTYRRLLVPIAESRPAATAGLAEGEASCAPPSMPASPPSARNASMHISAESAR